MSFLKNQYRERGMSAPEIHFVLGSGFSPGADKVTQSLPGWEEKQPLPFTEVPGLKTPGVEGHPGLYRYFIHKNTGRGICLQCGRLHGYEGHNPKETTQTVRLPFLAGTRQFVLTNSAGGLREDLTVGSVVALTDHINFTGQNPLTGPNPTDDSGQPMGDRFPDLSEIYGERIRREIVREMLAEGLKVEEGVYIGVLGPSFETKAEVRLFAQWGGSAVGMSTVWEALTLCHAGAELCAFSLISNPACGIGAEPPNHKNIMEAVAGYSEKILRSFFNYCDRKFQEN